MKIFFCTVLLCILATSLISSASVRSMPFLPFIVPIFQEMFPWYILFSWKKSLIFPILLFSSISLHWPLRKAFLSLLAILWNTAFKWEYLSFSPLPFSPIWLFATPWTVAHEAPLSWDSPGKNTGMDCHSLLQRIFPTQGSTPGLQHCSQILYHMRHQGLNE